MTQIITLTNHQRNKILKQLTAKQVQSLSDFTRYTLLSNFHTHHYLKQTDWQFVGIVVDPYYHRDHCHQGENLYCDCGRRLKNQFILRSKMTGKQLVLGINHFQQHASIPLQIIREIKAGINRINIYRDQILLAYQRGHRFPQKLYQEVVEQGKFKNHEGTLLYQRCHLFSQVNLPLHPRDFQELQQLRSSTGHRLTKAEIQQVKGNLAREWRQVNQQVTMFNYYLRTKGLATQALHRLKSNSVNYALRRRKSRFFITEYKQILELPLSKGRAQVEIKLRQLSFYVQLLAQDQSAKLKCEQARRTLAAHGIRVGQSCYYGLREGKEYLGLN